MNRIIIALMLLIGIQGNVFGMDWPGSVGASSSGASSSSTGGMSFAERNQLTGILGAIDRMDLKKIQFMIKNLVPGVLNLQQDGRRLPLVEAIRRLSGPSSSAQSGNGEAIIEVLISAGADLQLALEHALAMGDEHVVNWLMQRMGSMELEGGEERQPELTEEARPQHPLYNDLMAAIDNRNETEIEQLLKSGILLSDPTISIDIIRKLVEAAPPGTDRAVLNVVIKIFVALSRGGLNLRDIELSNAPGDRLFVQVGDMTLPVDAMLARELVRNGLQVDIRVAYLLGFNRIEGAIWSDDDKYFKVAISEDRPSNINALLILAASLGRMPVVTYLLDSRNGFALPPERVVTLAHIRAALGGYTNVAQYLAGYMQQHGMQATDMMAAYQSMLESKFGAQDDEQKLLISAALSGSAAETEAILRIARAKRDAEEKKIGRPVAPLLIHEAVEAVLQKIQDPSVTPHLKHGLAEVIRLLARVAANRGDDGLFARIWREVAGLPGRPGFDPSILLPALPELWEGITARLERADQGHERRLTREEEGGMYDILGAFIGPNLLRISRSGIDAALIQFLQQNHLSQEVANIYYAIVERFLQPIFARFADRLDLAEKLSRELEPYRGQEEFDRLLLKSVDDAITQGHMPQSDREIVLSLLMGYDVVEPIADPDEDAQLAEALRLSMQDFGPGGFGGAGSSSGGFFGS